MIEFMKKVDINKNKVIDIESIIDKYLKWFKI